MKSKIIALLVLTLAFASCEDFLERPPLDEIENTPKFWSNENNIRSTVYGLYDIYFTGYETGWTKSDFFEGTNVAEWTDDLAQETATFFTLKAPDTDTNWNFEKVRRINVIIEGVQNAELSEEAKNHWLGIARFFRAMEYSRLVRQFGDVPYFDHVLNNDEIKELYKPRDPRTLVMAKVLEDLEFASNNVRVSDGTEGLTVNRAVIDAYTSKIMLFEGTWQKYREKNNDYAEKCLQAAKAGARKVMDTKQYSISGDYKALTTSLDLGKNPEMLLYRSYEAGVKTHAEMSWQIEQTRGNQPSKSLIESYLTTNGLPIHQAGNSLYKGDEWLKDEVTNRDPRLMANIDTTSLKLLGIEAIYASSGYFGTRFINESLIGTADGQSSTNTTDAPIMKYNEVLLNYLESAAELAELGAYTLTQSDLDETINIIRARKGVDMPKVTLDGNNFKVNNIIVNDPEREGDVSSIIWEIRRERRIELVYEGIRFDDLRRWNKLYYADMVQNPKVNLGAWLDKDAFVVWYNKKYNAKVKVEDLKDIPLDRNGNKGYIKPITHALQMRTVAEKDYLYPIPTGQISLYESKSKELNDPAIKLDKNPGW